MELYLDSVDFKEIEAALDYGFIKGLTTTPTFMHKHGITDVDGRQPPSHRATFGAPRERSGVVVR